jgi:hypothetical protein
MTYQILVCADNGRVPGKNINMTTDNTPDLLHVSKEIRLEVKNNRELVRLYADVAGIQGKIMIVNEPLK